MLNMSDKKSKSYLSTYNSDLYPRGGWTFDWAKGFAYDNVYPSVAKLANEFMTIRPYAIDANGAPVEQANVVDKLYHPNQQMSSTDFREALAVTTLVHRKAYILVWHYEGDQLVMGGRGATEANIAGFTFLEGFTTREYRDGHKIYKTNDKKYEFTEQDIVEISAGVDPYDLDAGYSPTLSAKKWANVDDYIANYEAGMFENGAVPAGQFTITAPSKEAFDQIVDDMQRRHRGSGKNNNVTYVHRPISPDTGVPVSAQIEWTPYAQSNQTMSLDTIFKQANDKIDSAFGVPASIRGVNENKGYASVRIDEQVFIKYAVRPFATKIWTKFTHEMNRIVGGLGYAITFDLELPNIAEEEKVEAERKKIELDIISQAIDRGYSLDSIVDAFELSNSYKLLELGAPDDAEIINDKPDVDEGDEVLDTPELAVTKQAPHCCTHDHDVVHKNADKDTLKELRQLLVDYIETEIDETIDSNKLAKSKIISAQGLEQYDMDGDGLIDEYEASQIKVPEPDDKQRYALAIAMLAILLGRMKKSGEKRYQDTIDRFNIEITVPDLEHYSVSADAEERFTNALNNIANSFTEQIRDAIQSAIIASALNGEELSREDVVNAIRDVVNTEQWRVDRIVNTEEHRADNLGQVDAITQLEKATGKKFGLKWRTTSGHPCEFCQFMEGKIVKAGDAFVPIGGTIETEDSVYLNTYDDMLTPNAHPNCQCVFDVVEEN